MTDCIHSIIDGFPDYLHKLALAERQPYLLQKDRELKLLF